MGSFRNHVADTASSLGASFFVQKRGRNASDWWRRACDHGKVKEERRSDVLAVFSFPPSFARKLASRERDLWVRGNRRHVFRNVCTIESNIAKISGNKICFPRVTFKVTNNRDHWTALIEKGRMNRSQKKPNIAIRFLFFDNLPIHSFLRESFVNVFSILMLA